MSANGASRAEVCAVAMAECFRGDGEILASSFGAVPSIGARLARLTFAPDLLLTDGVAFLRADVPPVSGEDPGEPVVEGWLPFRRVFDLLWSGQRHVVMTASQIDRYGNHNFACIGPHARPKAQLLGMRGAPGNTIHHPTSYWVPAHSPRVFVERDDVVSGVMTASQIDRYGNHNFACIGPHARPKAQLLGMRGAPGNTIHHPTSYWVPAHSPRVFVERVDVVSGVGYDRAAALGPAGRYHQIRRVVSDLGVFDFATPDHRMRLVSVHPGVTVDEVVKRTGFALAVPEEVPETRAPTPEELHLIREVLDPEDARTREVPEPEMAPR